MPNGKPGSSACTKTCPESSRISESNDEEMSVESTNLAEISKVQTYAISSVDNDVISYLSENRATPSICRSWGHPVFPICLRRIDGAPIKYKESKIITKKITEVLMEEARLEMKKPNFEGTGPMFEDSYLTETGVFLFIASNERSKEWVKKIPLKGTVYEVSSSEILPKYQKPSKKPKQEKNCEGST